MKIGQKVFCSTERVDVVIVEPKGQTATVYSDKTGYVDVPKSSLLEYTEETWLVKKESCTSEKPKNNKIIGGSKMNIKRLFGEFGKVAEGEVAFTFDGKVAVRRNADEYVRFDEEKGQIVNHMSLVLGQASKFAYILPVTTVAKGDIIKFKNKFYQVVEPNDNGSLSAINLTDGTKSTICKETNAFGFNFYYKVTSLLSADTATVGGINPIMFLALSKDDKDIDSILPLMLMGQGSDIAKNPLLMMSLLGDGTSDIKDLLMLQAFSGQTTDGSMNPLLLMTLLK
jgi:hypothetical protein